MLGLGKKKDKFSGEEQAHQVVGDILKLHIKFPIGESRKRAKEWYLFCKALDVRVALWKKQARDVINRRDDDVEVK